MTSPGTLYAETARPAPRTDPLDGDRSVSVAVVGGGFTGLSAALHLAELGVSVAVLEAHEPGWGASGRNGGQVNPGLKHDPDQVEADFGARMVAFSGNAPNVVFDLIQRHQIACEALQSGTLRTAFHRRNLAGLHRTAEQWARRCTDVSMVDRETIGGLTGTDRYSGALLDRRGGQLNPLGFARGLAHAAMQAGAVVHGGTPVSRLRKNGGRWHLETPSGTVKADKIILATNGYTGDLWPGLRRSIVPVYSAIVASEPVPDNVMPTRSSLYELGQITVYYRKDRDGRILMGGRCVQRDISRPKELQYLIDYAVRLWPALRGIGWTHAWSGQLAITADHYPHVHEPDETVLVCLGYNGRGVAMSTAMGPELARRAIGGRDADIAIPVTGIKEIPLHGLWKSAVQARVAYGRVRDFLGL
ncbi:MAG: FAD-binding oxidoreductase [Acetobacteraceae bacterium]|nr:FAD-binding oxidoreductase [Acetobacteraceae bacterium]